MQTLVLPLRQLVRKLDTSNKQDQGPNSHYHQADEIVSGKVEIDEQNRAIDQGNQPGQMRTVDEPGPKIAQEE